MSDDKSLNNSRELNQGSKTEQVLKPTATDNTEKSAPELDDTDRPRRRKVANRTHRNASPFPTLVRKSSSAVDATGNTIVAGGNVTIGAGINGELNRKIEWSLSQVSYKLSAEEIWSTHSLTEDIVDERLIKLKKEHLILISCTDEEMALQAAYAIINRLEIHDDERKLGLRFRKFISMVGEDMSFTLDSLLEMKHDADKQTGIIVDALEGDAQIFSDSIFGNHMHASYIKNALIDKNLFVVCVAEPNTINRYKPEKLRFPHWSILRWQLLLKECAQDPNRYADLERKLLEQRERGKWYKDENDFCLQLKTYIKNEELEKIIDEGGPSVDSATVDKMLKISGLIEKVVLYTATFFQELTRAEFCCVVEALLGNRTVTVIATPYKYTGNGPDGAKSDGTQKEVSLTQIWEEEKDEIFREWLIIREWLCEITSVKGTNRVVTFRDPGLRDALKKRFEEEHLFYLIDKFKAIQEQGVFFYPSLRIIESTTRLAIEMAISYPDEYGASWITDMILRLRRHFDAEEKEAGKSTDPMFRFLKGGTGTSRGQAYSRISKLIYQMLEYPQLRKMANSSLENLMREKLYDSVLIIIKQLKSALEFDDLYWIKQILDRGNKETRSEAYTYLYNYVKSLDAGIYEALTGLSSWLPKEDQIQYSYSNFSALYLFIDFCQETIETFDLKEYGKWPNSHPLFAFADKETAASNLDLLVRWLLHPGMQHTLEKGVAALDQVGAMVASWTCILFGSTGKPGAVGTGNGNTPEATSSAANLDASTVWDMLLREIASKSDASQKKKLREYWDRLFRLLDEGVNTYPYTSDERKELFWQRDLIDTLRKRFMRLEGK